MSMESILSLHGQKNIANQPLCAIAFSFCQIMNKFCFLIVAICLSLPALCSIAVAESANPFGFETDRDPLGYGYCKKNKAWIFRSHGYTCESAPRPHPDLDTYALQFVKGIGLCRIAASGRYTQFAALRTTLVELLKQQLIYTYGQPIGSNKDNNEDMESAFHKEGQDDHHLRSFSPRGSPRVEGYDRDDIEAYIAKLDAKEQKFYWKPGGSVQSIELAVTPFTDAATFVHIYIKFTTFNACQQAIDEKGRDAFRHTDEIERGR